MCKISSILQYSTIDFRFLEANLKQLSKFSDEIIIPICDHFFNGDFENMELTDEQLEDISGGESVILAACAVLTVIGASFYAGYSMGKDRATTQQ